MKKGKNVTRVRGSWSASKGLPKPNGIIAGTANHAGHFPRVEVHIKDGYISDIKGGGIYGVA